MWEAEYTDEFERWWEDLSIEQQEAVAAVVALLQQRGPALKRPAVGAIKGSAFDPQMKELRVSVGGAELRILFVFDPRRVAILLVGGDKAEGTLPGMFAVSKVGRWKAWYRTAIPAADDLYRQHLEELQEEGPS